MKLDPVTHTLRREGVESIMNTFDALALEAALALKDSQGAEVSVMTMGLPQAAEVLREALSAGADHAYLVTSRVFAGADTIATSRTLAAAIRHIYGGGAPDAIFFGKQAIDGDTAQVGPEVSALLEVPLVAYLKRLEVVSSVGDYRAITTIGEDEMTLAGHFPAVFTVAERANPLRYASLSRTMEARNIPVVTLDEKDLAIALELVGLKGSPTKVMSTRTAEVSRQGEKFDFEAGFRRLLTAIEEARQ